MAEEIKNQGQQEKQNHSSRCDACRSRITDIRVRQRTCRYQRSSKIALVIRMGVPSWWRRIFFSFFILFIRVITKLNVLSCEDRANLRTLQIIETEKRFRIRISSFKRGKKMIFGTFWKRKCVWIKTSLCLKSNALAF